MKILFITSRIPYPPVGGDKLRVFNFLKALSKKHEITLVTFVQNANENALIENLMSHLKNCEVVPLSRIKSYVNCLKGLFSRLPLQVHYYQSPKMQKVIDNWLTKENFGLIFVHLFRMAEYVKDKKDVPKIIDLTDAISLNYRRVIEHFDEYKYDITSLLNIFEYQRVLKYETKIVRYFDKSLLISEVDKMYLQSFIDTSNIEVIRPGVDIDYFTYANGKYSDGSIVFLGNMRTVPNADAVIYFYKKIFPILRKDLPELKLSVVGTEPGKKLRKLSRDRNVEITGHVDDVRPLLRRASLLICPMRLGAGVKNKILESMAVGTPVLTTSIGAAGINVEHGKELMISDDPFDFAQKIKEILNNEKFRRKISINGRRLIEQDYTWKAVLDDLLNVVEHCVNKHLET